jgi:hypothetical protein
MLDFAYQHKKAINKITDMRDMKLRQYEIEKDEWEVIRQLHDLLKVRSVRTKNFRILFFLLSNKA